MYTIPYNFIISKQYKWDLVYFDIFLYDSSTDSLHMASPAGWENNVSPSRKCVFKKTGNILIIICFTVYGHLNQIKYGLP